MNSLLKFALLIPLLGTCLSYCVQVGELEVDISQASKELGLHPDATCSYRLTSSGPIVECEFDGQVKTFTTISSIVGTRGPVTPLFISFNNAIGSFAIPNDASTQAALDNRQAMIFSGNLGARAASSSRVGSKGNQVIFCVGNRCQGKSA